MNKSLSRFLLFFIVVSVGSLVSVSPVSSQGESVYRAQCLVTYSEQVRVSVREQGILTEMFAYDGMAVDEGTLLAKVDDQQSILQRDQYAYDLSIAQEQSENDINIRYSKAAWKVAQSELDSALLANQKVAGSIPQAEVKRLTLTADRARLEIEQSMRDQKIAKMSTAAKSHQLAIADSQIERRQLRSPIKGIVVEKMRAKGEWVKPGDEVLRIVRMDKLHVECFLDSAKIGPEVTGKPVRVSVSLAGNRLETVSGKIVFCSPEISKHDGKFLVRAEIDNTNFKLRPGAKGVIEILLGPESAAPSVDTSSTKVSSRRTPQRPF